MYKYKLNLVLQLDKNIKMNDIANLRDTITEIDFAEKRNLIKLTKHERKKLYKGIFYCCIEMNYSFLEIIKLFGQDERKRKELKEKAMCNMPKREKILSIKPH